MTVAELTMPTHEADKAFRDYRAACRRRATMEDVAMMRACRCLSRRERVIDLIQAMQVAGVDAEGRPRLAIAKADAESVTCRRDREGGATFGVGWWTRSNAAGAKCVVLPAGTFPVLDHAAWMRLSDCQARVPLVPPRYRPAAELGRYFLLWEAEWVTVPSDPILLRHLGRNLYAVIAQWDLTPLEQAILRARRRQ